VVYSIFQSELGGNRLLVSTIHQLLAQYTKVSAHPTYPLPLVYLHTFSTPCTEIMQELYNDSHCFPIRGV